MPTNAVELLFFIHKPHLGAAQPDLLGWQSQWHTSPKLRPGCFDTNLPATSHHVKRKPRVGAARRTPPYRYLAVVSDSQHL